MHLWIERPNEHIITYFYNNLGNKILTIPHSVRTTFIKKEGYRDYNVYRIDGEYYIYKGYKLNKIPLKITDMYISGIQTEIGDIAINEYDEKEFSKWIDYFRNDNNLKEIGDILLKLYNKKIEKEYPNLVRRLK